VERFACPVAFFSTNADLVGPTTQTPLIFCARRVTLTSQRPGDTSVMSSASKRALDKYYRIRSVTIVFTMLLQSPIGAIAPTLDADVLGYLAAADVAATAGEIAERVPGVSKAGVRKALQRLAAQGVLSVRRLGSADIYSLNCEHLAAEPVIALARLRQTYLDRIRGELKASPTEPVFAAVFGSAARGQMRIDSDIDLFMVRPSAVDQVTWDEWVMELSAKSTAWTGNDTRPFVTTEQEILAASTAERSVLKEIADEGIPVAGNPLWLRNVLRRRWEELDGTNATRN